MGYTWHQSHLGGGGYITGLVQSPHDAGVLYARCDVAGVFKSEDQGASWRPINRGMTLCHHHSVRSIAVSPHHPGVLLRCSGEARGHRLFGDVFKTRDGGESWYEVCDRIDYYGNGPTRMYGEVVAFDPFDARFAVAGSYSSGVWVSRDEGEHWSHAGLEGERIACVHVHPLAEGCIYVATTSDETLGTPAKITDLYHDLPREGAGRLYLSHDRGSSWELLVEGIDLVELAFDPGDADVLCGATLRSGILKSVDGGRTWEQRLAPPADGMAFNTITAALAGSPALYTAANVFPQHPVPPIALYRSVDRGETWQRIHHHGEGDLANYPSYATLDYASWAISKVRVDHADPCKLYISNWFGVARSDDGGRTFDAHHFDGTETVCGECILCDPTVERRVYFCLADHSPCVSHDDGRSYEAFQKDDRFHSSTALAASRHREGLVVYGLTNWGEEPRPSALARTEDCGATTGVALELPPGLFVQALAEDPHRPGGFYALVDGALADGAGLYRSDDWGLSWERMNVPIPARIETLPHRRDWIEAELLSVVVYQVKNVCGANQLLAVDPHREGVLYWGEWTEGLFEVTGGGKRVVDLGKGLPFGRDRASVLSVIKVDEQRPGWLYAGFIREGLWRSTDRGRTWSKLFPRDDRIFNASSVALGGREIIIAAEPLYWSPCPSSVVASRDLGATWVDVHDGSLGAVRWKGVALEPGTGTIHGVSCGNGCFRAERNE